VRRRGRSIAGAFLLTLSPACGSGVEVSVGRNDPVGSNPSNGLDDVRHPPSEWSVPVTVCDAASCRFGDCTIPIGICSSDWGLVGEGSCNHLPDACNDDDAPVCGCDGRTYANPCLAAHAGAGLYYMWPCH
jgi:Kazal-type serine protease inhibitor domain